MCTYTSAQVAFKGLYSSSFYTFENSQNNESRLNQYHGLNFTISPQNNKNLYFKGYIKAVYDNEPQEWREKVYNAYLSFKTQVVPAKIQLGRQFVYAGVVNGTLDALVLSVEPLNDLSFRFYGGVVAPLDRSLQLTQWDEGNALGAYGSYKVNSLINLNASYFQKQRNDELYWQQLGTAFSGNFQKLFYLLRYDHNLLNSDYQTILATVSYYYQDWSFSGEASSRKPKVYEDSFFSIFKLRENQQFRLAVSRRIMSYEIALQIMNTFFREDESNQHVILSFGNNWGVAGFVYQTGYGGENIGLYADINYAFMPNLKFNLHSSHYKYERQSIQLEEEATAFSAGVKYSPLKSLWLDAQIQESINNYYDSDLRGLFKLAYSFNY